MTEFHPVLTKVRSSGVPIILLLKKKRREKVRRKVTSQLMMMIKIMHHKKDRMRIITGVTTQLPPQMQWKMHPENLGNTP